MRRLKLAVPVFVLAAWLAASFAQDAPPAGTPPARPPPAGAPPGQRPSQPAPPAAEEREPAAPDDDADDDVEVPTELQPDAAVTFPVDI